jgi:hypothetical protein
VSNKNKNKVTSIGPVTDGEIVDKTTVAEAVKVVLNEEAVVDAGALAAKAADYQRAADAVKAAHAEKASIAFELLKSTLAQRSVELQTMRDADMDTLVSQAFRMTDKFKAVVDARYTTDLNILSDAANAPAPAAAAAQTAETGKLN